MMSEWVVSILLLIGGCFILIGSIGLVKMPDFFMRLHGPTKATTLGMASLLIAAMVYFTFTHDGVSVKRNSYFYLFAHYSTYQWLHAD